MSDEPVVILSTCADQDTAVQIAEQLVQAHLAACVNIVHNVTSVYRWQGNIQQDQELILVIKTTKPLYQSLEAKIQELHPYEIPEIIMLPIQGGSDAYLQWISQEVAGS